MSDSLAAALAEVQANLPKVAKDAKADTGKYSYTYATLTDVTEAVFPILSKHGLSFVCLPTVTDEGQFVLAYRLMHVSGEALEGRYPLPSGGTPQAQGSAITYARRYVLTALVGVAPEDDDGAAAEAAAREPKPSKPAPTSPKTLVVQKLKDEGIDGQVFADFLASTYGVKRFDELEEEQRTRVVHGLTNGDLVEQLRGAA